MTEEELREISAAFDLFDEDKSGAINFNEMSTALRKMGINLKDEQLELIIQEYDEDGNGQICLSEFTAIVANRFIENRSEKEHVRIFRAMDRDHDGFISQSDFLESVDLMGLEFSYQQVEALFAASAKRPELGISYEDMLRLMLYLT